MNLEIPCSTDSEVMVLLDQVVRAAKVVYSETTVSKLVAIQALVPSDISIGQKQKGGGAGCGPRAPLSV